MIIVLAPMRHQVLGVWRPVPYETCAELSERETSSMAKIQGGKSPVLERSKGVCDRELSRRALSADRFADRTAAPLVPRTPNS